MDFCLKSAFFDLLKANNMVINQLQNTQNPLAFRHLLLQISYYTFAAMVFYKIKLVGSRS